MDFILGVDAGNTKTVAVIATKDGTICGYGRSGCGDIYGASSPEQALSAVREAVQMALDMGGAEATNLLASGFSMAGADWPEDFTLLESSMKQFGFGKKLTVVNDAIGGLRSGSPAGYGVSVILGTGAAVGARGYNGRVWHGSFWMRSTGSGDLIEEMFQAVIRAELGIAEATSLTPRILQIFQVETVEQFLHSITKRGTRANVKKAPLISILIDEAVNGDQVAEKIVKKYGALYGDYAITAAKNVQLSTDVPFDLVYSGGMFRHPSSLLQDIITSRIQTAFPNIPVRSPFEPVIGALFLGFDIAKIPITENVKKNLAESMPDPSFFSTS